MRGQFIVSFIPRHVSNGVLLKVYRMLSLFGVPRFVSKKHYRENGMRLEQSNWDFWDEPNAYIENQNEWTEIRFGAGRRQSMSYAGCEIIATYNAWKALHGAAQRAYMAELIRMYEHRGAALWGAFGVTPTAIAAYFRKNGFAVEEADGGDETAVNEVGRKYAVMIATAYNDKNDITRQIHTVCITKNPDGNYVLHNAYCRDQMGRYRASDSYGTLQEAVRHISRREPKLIYLIGIR